MSTFQLCVNPFPQLWIFKRLNRSRKKPTEIISCINRFLMHRPTMTFWDLFKEDKAFYIRRHRLTLTKVVINFEYNCNMKKCGLLLLLSLPSDFQKNEFILAPIRILIANYQACLWIAWLHWVCMCMCLSINNVNNVETKKNQFNIFQMVFPFHFMKYICRLSLDLFDEVGCHFHSYFSFAVVVIISV